MKYNRTSFLPCLSLLAAVFAVTAPAQSNYTTPYYFSTFAGVSSIGSSDGVGSAARFAGVSGVVVDAAGNTFVVDEGNHTIRKVTPTGNVTTFAGLAGVTGSADGTGAAARFNDPRKIAIDSAGNLFVTDTGNHTIRKITAAGVVTTFAGLAGTAGTQDGVGSAALFDQPQGITVDATGNLYVTDAKNGPIRKITPGGTVTTLTMSANLSNGVDGIAVDAAGNVYYASFWQTNQENFSDPSSPGHIVSMGYQYEGWIHKLSPDGGHSYLEEFSHWVVLPPYQSYSSGFDSWVGGLVNNTGQPSVASQFTQHSRGTPAVQLITSPYPLAIDRTGNVLEAAENSLRITSAAGISTPVAGITPAAASTTTDGSGSAARFTRPNYIALDATGNLFVTDSDMHCVRKVTPAGVVTTFAGSPGNPGSADGTGSAARFNSPQGIAVDASGNVYVADSLNDTIRKISPLGETTTLAGSSRAEGSDDGVGSAARFTWPEGLAIDPNGNLYVSSVFNTVRKITPTGTVTTLAGTAGALGTVDGTGSAARFSYLSGIASDASGNLFVTEEIDAPYSTGRIRKITPAGVVTTLVGDTRGSVDGSSAVARFSTPGGIAADASGNLFVTDGAVVRKVTSDGVVSTVAGLVGFSGNTDGAGSDARFLHPYGIAVNKAGMLYVTSGTTIRQGQVASTPVISVQPASQQIAMGASAQFSVSAAAIPTPTYQWFFNGSPFIGATGSSLSLANVRSADAGDYTVVITNSLGSVTSSKATLTVSTASTPTPTTPSSSSGGGGGSLAAWFVLVLAALGAARGRIPRG